MTSSHSLIVSALLPIHPPMKIGIGFEKPCDGNPEGTQYDRD
jgi:hypothetical protein